MSRVLTQINRFKEELKDKQRSVHIIDVVHKDEYERCRDDIAYFVDTYCWIDEPREPGLQGTTIRFKLFPRQREFLLWMEQRLEAGEEGIVEKSRDVGATWLSCAFLLHKWLFVPGFKGTIGSRKSDQVDMLGVLNALLPKVRHMLERLPSWMVPPYRDQFMKLINSATGATITGEAGDNMGRGGRSSIYIIDEAAFIERSALVDAAISANSNCKIWVSTPNVTGNMFATKRHSQKFPVFTFHWWQDPRKTQEWYDAKKEAMDSIIFAQEVEIDYHASQLNSVIHGSWTQAATNFELNFRGVPRVAGLDVAGFGSNFNVLVIRQGSKVLSVDSWQGTNTTQTAYTALEKCKQMGVVRLFYDVIGVGEGVGATLSEADTLGIECQGVRSGNTASDRVWDGERRTSKEKFLNLRAELWWLVSIRFRNTFEHVRGIKQHPDSEMISILDDDILRMQLAAPQFKFTESGKIKVESKIDLRKRGVTALDRADALVLAFMEPDMIATVSRWGMY